MQRRIKKAVIPAAGLGIYLEYIKRACLKINLIDSF